MARNILGACDAIDRAKGINAGFDAMVSLLMSASDADVPNGKALAELLWSVQKDLECELDKAAQSLRQ